MEYAFLAIERRDAIAIVTLNRPERANALGYELTRELEHCALAFREDIATRVVIFTGAGRHFTSGMDLREDSDAFAGPTLLRRRRLRIGVRMITAMQGIDQITIAAWRGGAIGGGACLATALDFRVGTRDCFIQYPEVDLGMNLRWQSLPLCVQLVGPARAKRLVAGGERMHGPQLHEWGVLDELCAEDDPLPAALSMAAHYAAKPPIAVQMIKQSVNRLAGALDAAVMHMDTDQNVLTRGTADHETAMRAKRARTGARFTGD